jgi:molecular chaperone DnaK
MGRVLGIDLGTTNSCAAVVDAGTPLVVPTEDGRYVLPSVVAFGEDGKLIVGREAKKQSIGDAKNTVVAAKRLMGVSFRDPHAQQAIAAANYTCVEGQSGDIRVQIRDKTYAIPEISAFILAELKRCAELHFKERIDQAVITVPAYFNDFQRQATKDAGRIAGLEVLRILNEPTAAALAYGALQQGQNRRLVVYDLGGGTFDVSVLAITGGTIEVLATAGDAFLGGRDFDQRLVEWLTARIEQEQGISLANNKNATQRLWEAAEAAKLELSDKTLAQVTLPFLAEKKSGETVHVGESIDRETYEKLVTDLVERTMTLFVGTVKTAGLSPTELDEVILVGGMTRMPLVARRVREIIGRDPSSGVHPDLVVAVGAAIQGDLLSSSAPKTRLVDVTPHNLGIVTVAGLAETIIPKDTSIPTEAHRVFTTVSDNQEVVRIVVFQGDSRRMEHNQTLGEFVLGGIRPAPRGSVQVDVAFRITDDGIVNVAARDLETGRAQTIEIKQSHTLGAQELDGMVVRHREQMEQQLASLPAAVPQAPAVAGLNLPAMAPAEAAVPSVSAFAPLSPPSPIGSAPGASPGPDTAAWLPPGAGRPPDDPNGAGGGSFF